MDLYSNGIYGFHASPTDKSFSGPTMITLTGLYRRWGVSQASVAFEEKLIFMKSGQYLIVCMR